MTTPRAVWALLLASTMAVVGCSPPAAVPQDDPRPVRTVTLNATSVARDVEYPADIRPRVESRLGFRVPGKIIERLVDAGSLVKPGQVLARIDARDLSLSEAAARAQVASAQANYELAQTALRRVQALAARNFVSAAQIDQAQTQVRAAKGQLDAAEAQARAQGNQAAYATLIADRAGVVTAVEAEVGQVVPVGATVVRVAVGQDKDVVFNLPEQAARALAPGQTLQTTLWSLPGKALTAQVRDVSPAADPVTRTYQIKAALEDPQNIAALGLTATAHLPVAGAQQGIVVPLAAVVRGADGDGRGDPAAMAHAAVWIVDHGMARKVQVRIGAPVGDGLLITAGLSEGQQLITAGIHTIKEGQKVKPLEGSPGGT